jgi:hypothetical protein
MELKEFISESLSQIIDGIIDAQAYAKEKDATINPDGLYYLDGGKTLMANRAAASLPFVPQIIEFDVVVTVSESEKAKASLGVLTGVLGFGTQAQMESGSIAANRIKFSVPVIFPAHPHAQRR